jgi:hypothetical protein
MPGSFKCAVGAFLEQEAIKQLHQDDKYSSSVC